MVARNFAKVKDGVRFSVAALRANKLSPGGREEVCNTSVKRFDSVFALFSTFFGFLITKNVKVGYDIILFHTTKSYKQIRCFSLKTIVELKKNLPRSLKTEVERYIREQEDNPNRFDSTVLHARKALKRLYALLHIAPSERAQSILFDNDPPEDSQLFVLKKVVKEENPNF